MTTTVDPYAVRRFDDGLQIKTAADGTDRFRYRCPRCGTKGRWLRDGNTARDHLEAHEFGTIEAGRSRCRRA